MSGSVSGSESGSEAGSESGSVSASESASESGSVSGSASSTASVEAAGSGLFEGALAEPSPAQAAGAEQAPFQLGGYVRSDVFVGKVPGFDQGLVQAAYGELALELDMRAERYGDAYAEARLRYGQQCAAQDLFIDLREAYVDA